MATLWDPRFPHLILRAVLVEGHGHRSICFYAFAGLENNKWSAAYMGIQEGSRVLGRSTAWEVCKMEFLKMGRPLG